MKWTFLQAAALLAGHAVANSVELLPGPLNFNTSGIWCGAVAKESEGEAFIHVQLEGAYTKEGKEAEGYKIPMLIVKESEVKKLRYLQDPVRYAVGYSKEHKDTLYYVDDGKFILKYKEGEQPDESSYYISLLLRDPVVKLPVDSSAVYCVYIAPNPDDDILNFYVSVYAKDSTGNLPYLVYVLKSQLIYGILIGVGIGALLVHSITKTVGKGFVNMNRIPVISRATVFFILIPYVFILAVGWFTLTVANRSAKAGASQVFQNAVLGAGLMTSGLFQVYLRYCVLLFALGYGVIYYSGESSRFYRSLPKAISNRANVLLVMNLTVMVGTIIVGTGTTTPASSSETSPTALVVTFASVAMPVLWFIFSVRAYFQTKEVIAKFPPISAEVSGATDLNSRILTSFLRSIIIIMVLPVALGLVAGSIVGYSAYNKMKNSADPLEIAGEALLLGSLAIGTAWFSFGNAYLTIVAIYFLWIRTGNDLIVEKPDYMRVGGDEDFVGRFDVSDSE